MKIFSLIAACIWVLAHGPAAAQSSLTFCETGQWNSDACVSPCPSLNISALSNSQIGFCFGQATVYRRVIYKIEIGNDSGYTCEIFNGVLTLDVGNASPGVTVGRGNLDFKRCANRVRYDQIFLTTSRKIEYAGYTSYPDGSGKVARTTSYCSSDTLAGAIDDLSWLDTMSGGAYTSSNLCYVRESNTWSVAYKKAASSPTTADYAAASNVLIEMDDLKQMFLNSLSGPPYVRPGSTPNMSNGFYLERSGDGLGSKPDAGNSNRIVTRITESSGLVQLGTLEKSKQQKLTISYHAATRSASSQQYGLRFYFRRNGANAEFIGTNPSDDGLYIFLEQF